MEFFDDPEEMGAEERVAEIAAIVAVGLLRVRRARSSASPAPDPPNTLPDKGLDGLSAGSPPLDEGSTGGEPAPMEATE